MVIAVQLAHRAGGRVPETRKATASFAHAVSGSDAWTSSSTVSRVPPTRAAMSRAHWTGVSPLPR